CDQLAGTSQSVCSNSTLPDSSLIAALRSSQLTVSNGLSAVAGQKLAGTFSPAGPTRCESSNRSRAYSVPCCCSQTPGSTDETTGDELTAVAMITGAPKRFHAGILPPPLASPR